MTIKNSDRSLMTAIYLSSTISNVRDILECSDLEEALQTNEGKKQIENLQVILSNVLSVGDILFKDPTISDQMRMTVEESIVEAKDLLSVVEDLNFKEKEASDSLMEQE